MNRNLILILLAAVIVGGIAFSYRDTATTRVEEFTATPPVTTTTPITNNETVSDLNSQNNSGQSGRATLIMDQNGMAQLALNLTGEQDGASQPAHIHSGTCENLGDVLYPLNNVVNGQSETTLNVTTEQLKIMMPLAINVHKSVDEMDNYVACGDLKR